MAGAVALVTGAGRGIGRATAQALARAGARVVVASRSMAQLTQVEREIRSAGGEAASVTCDVASSSSVGRAFQFTRERFDVVDVLVNNAGMAEAARLVDLDEDLWHRTIAVNLTGTYLCMRAALPPMLAQQRGRIINIASTAARRGFAYASAYCAAKHGVLGLTRAVALEVASRGVTVNAICPGWVDTEMTRASIDRIVEKTSRTPAEARRALERMSPQGRLVQPEEVAAVAVYLAGPTASAITGQAYGVDGGAAMA